MFLADYDMLMTQELVGGVDLWINTPRRPWEACGTSGMKILANGGLNLSELDGWWAEAYAPDVGWAIGDGKEHGEDGGWDRIEAAALYEQLETDIIPAFYDRGLNGIPRRWTARMRESMARLTPTFSANRMLRQYTEQFYLSLASNYCTRAAHSGRESAKLLAWMDGISARWGELHFGNLVVNQLDGLFSFRIDVHLGTLKPDNVRVEIYADPVNGKELFRAPLSLVSTLSETDYMYSGTAPADRPASHYTPRIIPDGRAVSVPLELPLITWQK